MSKHKVIFLNPRTCGIYKSGGTRYKTDPITGQRTSEIDNELSEAVDAYLLGNRPPGEFQVPLDEIIVKRVLVPTYFDNRYNAGIRDLLAKEALEAVTIGELISEGIIKVRGGHGSPGNDQRTGCVPYIKVSDIRGLRVNVNPTNLVPESIAHRLWKGDRSGLKAWDLITPNRASSNIGEFAIILPGEERVVLTKEVFIFRIINKEVWDPSYLLWALSLRVVRDQWRRIALMQTNREDCGNRYREIILPRPKSAQWAKEVSKSFQSYFAALAKSKEDFLSAIRNDEYEYVANVVSAFPISVDDIGKEE